jgi:hypothetical protein
MRHLHKHVKYALVIIQIVVIAGAFLFFFGTIAMILFIAGEISFSEILEYLVITSGFESISVWVFLEGLLWTFFKHRVK